MVITVHWGLFATEQLIKAANLSLGLVASLNAAENMVTFAAGLHECGSTLQMTPNSRVYSTSLSYNPSPASNPGILRTSPAVLPIECHYPRTCVADDWSAERSFNGFQLGEVVHIQADVSTGNHVALKLFVDSCVATLSPDRDSSPQYAVIDFNGWSPVEGIRGGTSLCSCCETGNCGLLGGQCGRV
ncbi:unnamed protein product, partial [Natator depressus]